MSLITSKVPCALPVVLFLFVSTLSVFEAKLLLINQDLRSRNKIEDNLQGYVHNGDADLTVVRFFLYFRRI